MEIVWQLYPSCVAAVLDCAAGVLKLCIRVVYKVYRSGIGVAHRGYAGVTSVLCRKCVRILQKLQTSCVGLT